MPTKSRDFWRALTERCGALSDQERKFVELSTYETWDDEGGIELAEEHILHWREAGAWQGKLRVTAPEERSGKPDARWTLLRDLEAAAGGKAESPVTVEGSERITSLSPVRQQAFNRVTISFDSRMGKESLFREITRLWPHLQAAGWVRRSRAMKEHRLALVRFVCLETGLDATWRERMDKWNERHPEGHDLHYSDVRAFHSDFSAAEESLTGVKHGLDWFYDAEARWFWEVNDRREIRAAVEAGKISARAVSKHMKRLVAGASAGLDDSTRRAMESIEREGGGNDGDS